MTEDIAMAARRVLVIGPHCDDIELGCGGTVLKEIAAGSYMVALVMGTGAVTTLHAGHVPAEVRRAENDASFRLLGIHQWEYFSDAEGSLDTLGHLAGVQAIDAMLDRVKPDCVYLPLPAAHQDHSWTFQVCHAALRPSRAGHRPTEILAYEYPLTGWSLPAGTLRGSVYVDISAFVTTKQRALACHASQLRPGSLISSDAAEALSRFRGSEIGVAHAECFTPLRIVR